METTRSRGLGLTILLGLIIARDMSGAVLTATSLGAIRDAVPGFPVWALWASAACGLASAAGAVALFAWRRWGFFMICAAYAGLIGIGFAFGGGFGAVYSAVMSLFVVAILFAFLVRGGEQSAWARMR